MLNIQVFMEGLAKLKLKYPKFDFNLDYTKNRKQIEVWYEDFAHLTNKQYKTLINNYKSEFPPQSPRSILKLLDEIENGTDAPELFALDLLRINRRIGFNYNHEKAYEAVKEKYGIVGAEVAQRFEHNLINLQTSDVPNVRAQIREAYRSAKQQVKNKPLQQMLGVGLNVKGIGEVI